LVLASCGAAAGSDKSALATSGSSPSTGTVAGGGNLTLSKLSSLRNYTFTTNSSNANQDFAITGQVHDPTDWQTKSTVPVPETRYDVGGRGYAVTLGQVIQVSFATPEGLTNLDGEYSAAQSLVGYTHVTGETITTAGSCRVAGEAGTIYHLRSPGDATALLVETATACVAQGSGALLSYSAGIPSGSAARSNHLTGNTFTFTVESIGGVATIQAPKAPSAPPTSSAPSALSSGAQLPPGFPAQVAGPPGKVLSSAQLSSTKWYVQLTETSSVAFSRYEAQLKSQGFSIASSSNNSGIDLVTLAKGQFQVLLEQTSFPGQGVVLAVTVQS
jgi:hypothetical protein